MICTSPLLADAWSMTRASRGSSQTLVRSGRAPPRGAGLLAVDHDRPAVARRSGCWRCVPRSSAQLWPPPHRRTAARPRRRSAGGAAARSFASSQSCQTRAGAGQRNRDDQDQRASARSICGPGARRPAAASSSSSPCRLPSLRAPAVVAPKLAVASLLRMICSNARDASSTEGVPMRFAVTCRRHYLLDCARRACACSRIGARKSWPPAPPRSSADAGEREEAIVVKGERVELRDVERRRRRPRPTRRSRTSRRR